MIRCEVCSHEMAGGGLATEVYRQGSTVVVVTGIPAVAVCPECENAILEWEIAQAIEAVVQSLLRSFVRSPLPAPAISITFPVRAPVAA